METERSRAMRAGSIALLVILAGVLGMAGCGSSGGGTTSTESAAATTESGADSAGVADLASASPAPEHTNSLPTKEALDPPLKMTGAIDSEAPNKALAVAAGGVAYIVSKPGETRAVRLSDGKTLWQRAPSTPKSGPPTEATAPIYSGGRIFVLFTNGELAVLDAASGKSYWRYNSNSYVSDPPIVVNHTIYATANKTNIIAFLLRGSILYEKSGIGLIRSSPTYHNNRIFLANSNGSMICSSTETELVLWRTATSNGKAAGGSGFSASPAVAFGNVYAMRDDGVVFALNEKSGKIAWSAKTSEPADGPVAVAKAPGAPAGAYVGSGRSLYGFDALTGKQRWRYDAGGQVVGPPVVVGHTVYFSTSSNETIGVDVRTGRKTFDLSQGAYTPVAAEQGHIYMFGAGKLIALEPTG
jgi:outer membrane protein assembly factor BamB